MPNCYQYFKDGQPVSLAKLDDLICREVLGIEPHDTNFNPAFEFGVSLRIACGKSLQDIVNEPIPDQPLEPIPFSMMEPGQWFRFVGDDENRVYVKGEHTMYRRLRDEEFVKRGVLTKAQVDYCAAISCRHTGGYETPVQPMSGPQKIAHWLIANGYTTDAYYQPSCYNK